jgi:hypothetical protein
MEEQTSRESNFKECLIEEQEMEAVQQLDE